MLQIPFFKLIRLFFTLKNRDPHKRQNYFSAPNRGEIDDHKYRSAFLLKTLLLGLSLFTLSACQMGYYLHSAYHQTRILKSRVPVERVLKDPETSPEVKRKLKLAKDAMKFASNKLRLKGSKNYQTYVKLDEPYVTYLLTAASAHRLKAYRWKFPLIGSVPYKGYFRKAKAEEARAEFDSKLYDTAVRGVTAYSTLGWFNDPLLSSMMGYSDHDFVSLVIHETVHANLFIKNQVEFNERLATFLGQAGAQQYFLDREGPESLHLKKIQLEAQDEKVFSKFISNELKKLEAWYESQSQYDPQKKHDRLKKIQSRFRNTILPQLKSSQFRSFADIKLNNAVLIGYRTYLEDQSYFELAYKKMNENFDDFFKYCVSLEKSKDPQQEIITFAKNKKTRSTNFPTKSKAK